MRYLLVAVVGLILIASAHAQRMIPPINLLQEREPDDYTKQRRKEIENEYNSAVRKIPDQKKKQDDPWQSLRTPDSRK